MLRLEKHYGMSRATLERIGAFIVMWALFENQLETALWRLTGENPNGVRPSTDAVPVTALISRFREETSGAAGDDWRMVVDLICETAGCLAEYRNAIAHGQLLPASVGGGSILNARWHGEQRKREPVTAHLDENLVGSMLDALQELLICMQAIVFDDAPPFSNPRILERQQPLRRARSLAGEIRHLTALMNHEKY